MDNQRFRSLFGAYSKDKLYEFWQYHKERPEIYGGFLRLAEKWRDRGVGTISANAIWHVLRYEIVTSSDEETYKLPNQYAPLYARLLVWRMPEFEGMFEFRK